MYIYIYIHLVGIYTYNCWWYLTLYRSFRTQLSKLIDPMGGSFVFHTFTYNQWKSNNNIYWSSSCFIVNTISKFISIFIFIIYICVYIYLFIYFYVFIAIGYIEFRSCCWGVYIVVDEQRTMTFSAACGRLELLDLPSHGWKKKKKIHRSDVEKDINALNLTCWKSLLTSFTIYPVEYIYIYICMGLQKVYTLGYLSFNVSHSHWR